MTAAAQVASPLRYFAQRSHRTFPFRSMTCPFILAWIPSGSASVLAAPATDSAASLIPAAWRCLPHSAPTESTLSHLGYCLGKVTIAPLPCTKTVSAVSCCSSSKYSC